MSVNVAIEPFGHVGDGENAKRLCAIGGLLKRGIIEEDAVTFRGEGGIVVSALIRGFARDELFSSAAKQNVGTGPVGPSVIGDAVEVGVDNLSIHASISGMRCQGRRSSVCNECGRHNTNTSAGESPEHFCYSLNLRVVEWILGAIGVDTQRVDRALVARI